MVEIDKEYILIIDNLGYDGEGIGRHENFPVFIKNALKDEIVKVKIIEVKKKFARAELVEVIEPSKDRIEPYCDIYGKCGGCALQHLNAKAQTEFKFERVKDCIRKIGGIDESIVKYPISMENGVKYRNKVQFPAGEIKGKTVVGFFNEGTHKIIDVNECLLADDDFIRILNVVKTWIKCFNISMANKNGKFSKKGLLRHIVIRKSKSENKLMVILVTTDKEIPFVDELIQMFEEKECRVSSLIQNINIKDTNVVMGIKCRTLFGSDYITDTIGKFKFKISPLSFFQVNPVQTEVLYNKALEFAGLQGEETVFDAYCGTGTISLFLSQKAAKVYGVEIIPEAIENAKENAELNNVHNTEFFAGKSEEVIPKLINEGIIPDVVVVDPPRKGCDKKLLDSVLNAAPEKIVYVSCDPSTLARDLKYLSESNKYEVKIVQPVDMFPMTKHVESVVLMSRVDK